MAVLGTTTLTLIDWAKRLDPNGALAEIVEVLNTTNEINQDVPYIEGNLPTGHRSTIRTGIPVPTWRLLNYGVVPTKSTTAQVDDTCGMMEAYAEQDKDLVKLNANPKAFRFTEDKAHLEGMGQEFASTLFYGNTLVNPEKFVGLSPRYNALSGADSAANIIAGGGAGADNMSVWLIVWGSETVHGIFPKNSKAGLTVEDLGQVTLIDAAGGRYEGFRTHFQQKVGLVVRDWRYAVRICNIDVSNLTKDASGTSADLLDLMAQAVHKPPTLNKGRAVFYANQTCLTFLDRQVMNRSNMNLTYSDFDGKMILNFRGIPIRKCDALLENESLVS